MSATSSIELNYEQRGVNLKGAEFRALSRSADAFICAAGFEIRGERAPLAAEVSRNPVIIAFKNGPPQNDKTFRKFAARFKSIP